MIDTIVIPQVSINAKKELRTSSVGSNVVRWRPNDVNVNGQQTLANLLDQTGVFIKQNGAGLLATPLIRGAKSSHSLVLWNGLPVSSPTLGLVDLSLIPMWVGDDVSLTLGGGTSLWGSGAIGGIISIDNNYNFDHRWSLGSQTEIGSFGHWNQQLQANVGNDKIQISTRWMHQQTDNDYSYRPAPSLPIKKLKNAKREVDGFQQDVHLRLRKHHQLNVNYWWQKSDVQIPPTLVQSRSQSNQQDESHRIVIGYKYLRRRSVLSAKVGWFDETQNYNDELTKIYSVNAFTKLFTEVTAQWNRGNHKWLIGNTNTITKASTGGYRGFEPRDNRYALFASWGYNDENYSLELNARQLILDSKLQPTVISLGLEVWRQRSITLKGKVSRNYHLPTLNDRYWIPGGNPDILAESGWSEELSLAHVETHNRISISTEATVFNRTIRNWIYWTPDAETGTYAANNIAKVWSRGLELRVRSTYALSKGDVGLSIGYDLVRSTNQVSISKPSIDKGEQLYYVPVHQLRTGININWQSWKFTYRHSLTSELNGINAVVDSYNVGDVRLAYTLDNRLKTNIYLAVNNVWNRDYQIVEYRPMPRINVRIGINFYLNKTNTNDN